MGRWGGGALGGILIDRFGPGVGHLNSLAVPGVGIFEFLFVPVTTNHFPGWEIQLYFYLTFLPGGREFHSNFLANVKIPPYAPSPPIPPPPAGFTLIGALAVKKKAINASFELDSSVLPGARTAGAAAVCKIATPDKSLYKRTRR